MLGCQVFLLRQQFLLLGNQPTDFGAQFGELFLEPIHRSLRIGLFAFVVAAQALQQRFGLVIRVFVAAADRAGLIILQLCAQFLDAGAACQALAFEQFTGNVERLFGHHQFGLGLDPVLGQTLTFLLGLGQALLQLGGALVQLLLAGPQPGQVLDRAQVLAVILQQTAENADLLGHGVRFGGGFLVQHFQLLFLRGQCLRRFTGSAFEAGQFGLALVEPVTDQHQLLQAIAVGIPGFAQMGKVGALLQLCRDLLQAFGDLLLSLL